MNLVDIVAEMIPAADWWPPMDELCVFDDGEFVEVWWIGYFDGEDEEPYASYMCLDYSLAAWAGDLITDIAEMLGHQAAASQATAEHGEGAQVAFKEGIGWVYEEG